MQYTDEQRIEKIKATVDKLIAYVNDWQSWNPPFLWFLGLRERVKSPLATKKGKHSCFPFLLSPEMVLGGGVLGPSNLTLQMQLFLNIPCLSELYRLLLLHHMNEPHL